MKLTFNFTIVFCLMALIFSTYMQFGSMGATVLVMCMAAEMLLFVLYIENKEK